MKRLLIAFCLSLLSTQAFLTPDLHAGDPLGGAGKGIFKLFQKTKDIHDRDRPPIGKNPTIEAIAGEIDWLEHHIDVYGSVIPKQPDVWGESRLTGYRQDVEEQLVARLNQFESTLQAALRRSDVSELSFAIALGAASSGRAIPSTAIGTTIPTTEATHKVTDSTFMDPAGDLIKKESQTTVSSPSPSASIGSLASFTSPGQLSPSDDLALEPVIYNEQLNRYLNALNQLRRINDGDDNSDAPGYSLNLVRIPISVLPGKHTQTGYGAEISITAEPVIGADLLPNLFRQLVINDLVDQLALPMTQLLSDHPRGNTARLMRLMRAEAEADRLAEKMQRRMCDLQAVPNSEEIYRFFFENFEYLRNRFQELSALQLAANDDQIRNFDPEESVRYASFFVGRTSFLLDDRNPESNVEIEAYVSAGTLLKSIDELLSYGITVQPLELRVTLPKETMPKEERFVFQYPMLISEIPVREYANYVAGQMPYQIEIDFEALPKTVDSGASAQKASEEFAARWDSLKTINESYRDELMLRRKLDPSLLKLLEELLTSPSRKETKATQSNPNASVAESQETVPASFLTRTLELITQGDKLKVLIDRLKGTNYKDLFSIISERGSYNTLNYNPGTTSVSSPSRQRRSLQALPPSQFAPVYGNELLAGVAQAIARTTHMMPINDFTYIHLADVRKILHEELSAAYDMMCRPEMLGVWTQAGGEISAAVTGRKNEQVRHLRKTYLSGFDRGQRSDLAVLLSWAIVVESSLLNDFMVEEIDRLAKDRGLTPCTIPEMQFWGPTPSEEARDVFRQYVAMRWPIHVFALDPMTQDQNIDDDFAMQRNLQLAAAVAIAKGSSNLNATMNFVRKLEAEMKTIGLNRTAVAFSHGQSTFGWRFYPRFQSPDTPSTIGAFGQTLLGGPNRADLLRQRQIEPGIRECTAIIVMPSFIPYLSLQSRSSWFCLNNPSSRELTLKDSMRLSSVCESITQFTACANDSRCYRPGDVATLSTVAMQLSERLPLRAQMVPVPFENELGGFQMFSSGANELGVELTGWYGAPGISLEKDKTTTLFLVGRGFSNLHTSVIVGGVRVCPRLLSREIMQIEVPSNVNRILSEQDESLVSVSIATPYGASSSLLIPSIPLPKEPKVDPSATWTTDKILLTGVVKLVKCVADAKGEDCLELGDLSFGNGSRVSFVVNPSGLGEGVTEIYAELLISTPAGIGWAPEFHHPLRLKVAQNARGEWEVDATAMASLKCQLQKTLQTSLCYDARRMEWNLYLRGKIPASEKRPDLFIGRDVPILVRLMPNDSK